MFAKCKVGIQTSVVAPLDDVFMGYLCETVNGIEHNGAESPAVLKC
jgi:hypothetical protein